MGKLQLQLFLLALQSSVLAMDFIFSWLLEEIKECIIMPLSSIRPKYSTGMWSPWLFSATVAVLADTKCYLIKPEPCTCLGRLQKRAAVPVCAAGTVLSHCSTSVTPRGYVHCRLFFQESYSAELPCSRSQADWQLSTSSRTLGLLLLFMLVVNCKAEVLPVSFAHTRVKKHTVLCLSAAIPCTNNDTNNDFWC